MLVLQGGRDYQVTAAEDFAAWKQGLEGRPNARLKLWPELDHLFMPGEGMAMPAEYARPGHVAQEVVVEIADWIKSR